MRIAFTSCFDVLDDPEQVVWGQVAAQRPDVMVLLGDSIYMDFGVNLSLPGFHSTHPLGMPKKWDDEKFAQEMYSRYQAQSEVNSFRSLVGSVGTIGAIWDDHDFAWNDSWGAGTDEDVVPRNKKLIARTLHLQFRDWLQNRPLVDYPAIPSMDSLLNTEDRGIEYSFSIGPVLFLMLDGRYYREEQREVPSPYPEIHPGVPLATMLGEAQRSWLAQMIKDQSGVSVICSGSTLTDRNVNGADSWDRYTDFDWLLGQDFQQTIVLSGDIHDIRLKKHGKPGGGNLWEFTASGAARPGKFHGASGNFGILDVDGRRVTVRLFDEDGPRSKKVIDF